MTTSALVVIVTVVMATTLAQQPNQTEGPAHFKLGFLAPWTGETVDFSALTSASALSIAIERVHNDPTLNKRMRFRSAITSASRPVFHLDIALIALILLHPWTFLFPQSLGSIDETLFTTRTAEFLSFACRFCNFKKQQFWNKLTVRRLPPFLGWATAENWILGIAQADHAEKRWLSDYYCGLVCKTCMHELSWKHRW